jgi:hypothetical protein
MDRIGGFTDYDMQDLMSHGFASDFDRQLEQVINIDLSASAYDERSGCCLLQIGSGIGSTDYKSATTTGRNGFRYPK